MNNQNESHRRNHLRINWTLSLVWLVLLVRPTTALAQDNFYQATTIRFVPAYEPGGGFDVLKKILLGDVSGRNTPQ
ncbi:MAG: hypothetical protein ACREQO_11945 [Candidatus Binatia bacterium]